MQDTHQSPVTLATTALLKPLACVKQSVAVLQVPAHCTDMSGWALAGIWVLQEHVGSLQNCTEGTLPSVRTSRATLADTEHLPTWPHSCAAGAWRSALRACWGVPQTPDFEEDAWKREDNLPALLAFTLERNILVAREKHRVREEARAEELRRLALAELEVSGLQGRAQGLATCFANLF